MSTDSITFYDIEAMIRDAQYALRRDIDRTVSELRQELMQLLDEERAMRQDAIDSVYRVLNARTENAIWDNPT